MTADQLDSGVREARAALAADFRDRWVTNMPLSRLNFLMITTLCDPRFRALDFALVNDDLRARAREWFCGEYNMNWAPPKAPPAAAAAAPADAAAPAPPVVAVTLGSFSMFMKGVQKSAPAAHNAPPARVEQTEAERFLAEDPVPMDFDLLTWWGQNETRFPNLARMAAQFLGCPATSASAERIFSVAGRIYGDLSQHMNDETLEERMFAKINIGKRVPVEYL